MKPSQFFSKKPTSQIQIVKNPLEHFRQELKERLKKVTLTLAVDLMSEELHELCGGRFERKGERLGFRTGSDPGSIYQNGQRVKIRKPRARDKDGHEIHLQSYEAMNDFDLLSDQVTGKVLRGVSTRDYDDLLEEVAGGVGLSRSTVSKAFKRGSKKLLDELNGRSLSGVRLVCIMIDGIEIAERNTIVALGITDRGKKLILGIREGDTENAEVVKDLFHNLVDRGLNTGDPVLFVLDGAKALKKAVEKLYGKDAVVQRCVRHKERNILGYLPEANHPDFRRRWKRLHGMKNYQEALGEHKVLLEYLGEINYQAASSLEEAKLETLTVIKLGVPELLRKTLSSTNPIENPFQGFRRRTNRVTHWKKGHDQIARWMAANLMQSETKFRMVRGFAQIPILINALKTISGLQTNLEIA